jgi:hypothetical protein
VVALPGGAAAADWSKPTLLDPTPPTFVLENVSVAANARGDAVAVWERSRLFADGATCCDDHRVIASYRPAGGVFGKPEAISRLGDEATWPGVAIDAAGTALVAWTVNGLEANDHYEVGAVGAAFRRAGAAHFDRPGRISGRPGEPVVVAAGAPGEAVVAWEELAPSTLHLNDPRRVMAAVQSGPATLSRPAPVSATNAPIISDGSLQYPMSMELAAAADGAGTTSLAWLRADGTSSTCCVAIEASRRSPGGDFEPPVAVTPREQPDQVHSPHLSANAGGTLVTWMRGSPQQYTCCRTLAARDWPAAGDLGPARETELNSYGGVVALDSLDDGFARALVVTGPEQPDSSQYDSVLSATARPPGGAFAPTQPLDHRVGSGALLVDADGGAHAIWDRYTKDRCDRYGCTPIAPRIFAADAPPGSAFGSSRPIIGPRSRGADPTITAWGGAALASWGASRGPVVAGLGASPGPAPRAVPRPGPALSRFARIGPRSFEFRLSEPATVLLEIARHDERSGVVGQVTVAARAGKEKIVIPRKLAARMTRRYYVATLIATDASGHDSAAIEPIRFKFAPSTGG